MSCRYEVKADPGIVVAVGVAPVIQHGRVLDQRQADSGVLKLGANSGQIRIDVWLQAKAAIGWCRGTAAGPDLPEEALVNHCVGREPLPRR